MRSSIQKRFACSEFLCEIFRPAARISEKLAMAIRTYSRAKTLLCDADLQEECTRERDEACRKSEEALEAQQKLQVVLWLSKFT
jgi:hypothetical protein